ncbi:MAG: integrase [Bacillota bacterium]
MHNITVGEWIDRWFTDRIGQWTTSTVGGYRNLICRHIIPEIGKMKLSKLSEENVQSFYARLVNNGLSTRSVWCIHLLLRRALDEACRERLIEYNPAKGCEVPKGAEHETNFLRIGQIQRYLKAADEHGVLPLIYIGLTSGLRQCELFTLLWADFDAQNRFILRGKRLLTLNEKAAALLAEEFKRHSEKPQAFINPKTGDPYQLHEFYYLHRKLLSSARLPWIPFRDLARRCKEVGI